MSRPGAQLALRFKSTLDAIEDARHREEEARLARLALGREARTQVLDDLEAFARALVHLAVARTEDGLTVRYRDHHLHFAESGDGDRLRVSFDTAAGEHSLYREAELKHRWVWAAQRTGGEDRLPLFDQGLEELMIEALALPRPGSVDEGYPPTLDELVPEVLEDDDAKRTL